MRAAKAAKRSAPQVTSPAWETATMAWASARVMFITDAPYPATVGHAEAKKPMAASSENRQSPEGRPEIPEVLNQRQTLLASHISSVVFQFAAETVHARIAKSEMLKPCRPMEARGPGEFVLFYSGPESDCRTFVTLERSDDPELFSSYFSTYCHISNLFQ